MKTKILLCVAIMLLMVIAIAHASSTTEGIVSVVGKDLDARVKLRETPKGKIIGQYYYGAHYTADEEKNGWVHVTIDLQGLPSGGDSWTRTNGLPSVGQVRNRRADALERHLHSLLTNKLEALSPSANSPLG